MACIELPEGEERERRVKEGLSSQVAIDACIASEIRMLWENGIRTLGCCCGHNKCEPFVNVDQRDIDKMLYMGYQQNHEDKSRNDTFRLRWNRTMPYQARIKLKAFEFWKKVVSGEIKRKAPIAYYQNQINFLQERIPELTIISATSKT